MQAPDLDASRELWLLHLASVVTIGSQGSNPEATVGDALNSVEHALIEAHVGLSHLSGADRNEASLDGFCTPAAADRIISRWRSGHQSADLAGELSAVWLSLWRVGVWVGLVRSELSDGIANSFVTRSLEPGPPGEDPLRAFWDTLTVREVPAPQVDPTWDCLGSHLAAIRYLENLPHGLVESLLPLEKRALLGARRHSQLEESVKGALDVMSADLLTPGGWGGPRMSDVPPWLRDYAIAQGGRILQNRAGLVPCWFFVAESVEELRAISAWRYSPGPTVVGSDQDHPNRVLLGIELDFEDGESPTMLSFLYDTTHRKSAASLDMLAWVGLIRLEVYTITNSELEFAFASCVRVPGAREILTDPALRAFPEDDWFSGVQMSSDDILFQMRNRERVQFELIRRGEDARRSDVGSTTAVAYSEYLAAVDDGTRSNCAGIGPDLARIERAHRDLGRELASLSDPVPEIAIDSLDTDWGFLQMNLITDEPLRITGAIAYRDISGEVKARLLNLAEHDYEHGLLVADDDNLNELVDLGLSGLVLSPSGPLYALPLHEDFLDEGFTEVSYAHRSGVIADRSPHRANDPEILLSGWSGDDASGGQLTFLEAELLAIERTYRSTRGLLPLPGQLPPVVHLAGHGMAGKGVTDHWLRASPSIEELVTPAKVLLDVDASFTDLVFLSSCSSGRGVFGSRNVMEAMPLDIAFLERGASCVVSTSAPVNDAVSAAFAVAFHVAWRAGGSIWEAYVEARSLASRGDASDAVREAIEQVWPSWKVDLQRASIAHPEDWMRFRLSGQHR